MHRVLYMKLLAVDLIYNFITGQLFSVARLQTKILTPFMSKQMHFRWLPTFIGLYGLLFRFFPVLCKVLHVKLDCWQKTFFFPLQQYAGEGFSNRLWLSLLFLPPLQWVQETKGNVLLAHAEVTLRIRHIGFLSIGTNCFDSFHLLRRLFCRKLYCQPVWNLYSRNLCI